MQQYGYVQDGKIVEGPKALPSSWQNVSGLNLLSEAELTAIGWLPWNVIEVPGDVLMGSTVEITPTEIVETQIRRNFTQDELDAQENDRRESSKRQRQLAYTEESDPIFFKMQRGEATQEEWLQKIAEIKGRFP